MALRYDPMQPLKKKWAEVYEQMAVHTQEGSPELIFRQRRPVESSQPVALQYRLDNHRNVVKSAFDLAIEQYIEAAYNVDATVSIGELTTDYLDAYVMFDGYKETTVKQWLFSFVGRYKQTDPNAFVAVIPMHPTDDLVSRYDAAIPEMESALNQPPRPYIWLVPSADIEYVSDEMIKFKAGAWVTDDKGNTSAYYFEMSKSQVSLIYPVLGDKGVTYVTRPWYAPDYSCYTAFTIGTKKIVDSSEQGEMIYYYVSDFYGAANVADRLVANMSDLDIIENRFTHPIFWQRKKECDETGCRKNYETKKFEVDGHTCRKCNGTGFIADTSPMGTFLLDEEKDFAENGSPKLPAGFITPEVGILDHKAKRVDYYFHTIMRELGLNLQNMTSQSGESKRYDLMQKVTLISGIVVDLYALYESLVAAVAYYLGDSEMVSVTLPKDFDIKNSDDISEELKSAKLANLPYAVLTELTKKYLLSKFGNTEKNRFKTDYLALKDKLFVYGIEDMGKATAILGRSITDRERTIHVMGWQILDKLLTDAVEINEAAIDTAFNAQVEAMLPTAVDGANLLI